MTVDGAPEEHRLAFPFLRDKVGVGQVKVQQVGVEDRETLKLPAKPGTDEHPAFPLFLVQVKDDLLGVEFELPALYVLYDFPFFGYEWLGIAVDNVFASRHYLLLSIGPVPFRTRPKWNCTSGLPSVVRAKNHSYSFVLNSILDLIKWVAFGYDYIFCK